MENIDFVQRISDFCTNQHITAEIVREKAGITNAHFYNVKNRKGPQITMPFLVRFCTGLKEYGAEEYILSGIPIRSFDKHADTSSIIYDFDLAAYAYFSYGRKILTNRKSSFPNLIGFLAFLVSVYSCITDIDYNVPNSFTIFSLTYQDFLKDIKSLENGVPGIKSYLSLPIYNALFSSLRNRSTDLSFTQPRSDIYQYFNEFYSTFGTRPEVITWTDIADCVACFRDQHHLSNVELDKKAGATQGLSGRFEYQQSKIYRCADVMKMDGLFGDDHHFFSLCYRATMTSLLLDSMYDLPNDDSQDKQEKITSTSFFIRLMRCIQVKNPDAAAYVLAELRGFFQNNRIYGNEFLFLAEGNEKMIFAETPGDYYSRHA